MSDSARILPCRHLSRQVGQGAKRLLACRRLSPLAAGRLLLLLLVLIASLVRLETLQSYSNYYFKAGRISRQRDNEEGETSSTPPPQQQQQQEVEQQEQEQQEQQQRKPELCAGMNMSVFAPGKACGLPLSAPCFNSTRCAPLPRPLMYVYDHSCSLANSTILAGETAQIANEKDRIDAIWRTAAANAGLLAETYESACLFVHVNLRADKAPCAPGAPLWNEGSNHVMVDLTDNSRASRPAVAASLAMEAAVNVRTCFYRSGYDISVPLAPQKTFPELATVHPLDRRFFLAFKGTVYIAGGAGTAERMPLAPLNDPDNGVAVVVHCFEMHGDHLKPENVEHCAKLRSTYEDYSYRDVMNTTFALVPAGRSPASYRLGEVMSAGSIPVFVSTSTVRPFAEELEWSAFSFAFSPDEAGPDMVRFLRAVPREELETMQRKSLEAYNRIFGNSTHRYDTVARNVLEVLERRLTHHRK